MVLDCSGISRHFIISVLSALFLWVALVVSNFAFDTIPAYFWNFSRMILICKKNRVNWFWVFGSDLLAVIAIFVILQAVNIADLHVLPL